MGFVHYEMLGWVLQPAIQYLRVAAKCFQLEHLESQLPLLANVSTLPKVSSTTGQVLLFKGSELYHINKTNIKQTIKHHPYPLQTSQHQQNKNQSQKSCTTWCRRLPAHLLQPVQQMHTLFCRKKSSRAVKTSCYTEICQLCSSLHHCACSHVLLFCAMLSRQKISQHFCFNPPDQHQDC